MKKRLPIAVAKAILLCCCMMAGGVVFGQEDSTVRVRTLGLVVGGTAFNGIGVGYEQSFKRSTRSEPMSGYLYWHGCIGFAPFYDQHITPTIGTGFHQPITRNKKFFVGAGLNAGLLINLDPTSKELRDYYDSVGFYGGRYVNPVEVVLIPEIDLSYLGEHWFLRLQYTPVWATYRTRETEIAFAHWGGLVTGYRF